MASVNRLAAQRLPAWITLTYPDAFPEDRYTHKAHLRAFLKRLRRKVGDLAVVWRLEWQRRGAPHYHILVWDMKVTKQISSDLRVAWHEIVGSNDPNHLRHGLDIMQANDWRGVTNYLSKYMGKVSSEEDHLKESTGRIWGIECAEKLPVEPLCWLVSLREGLALRRNLARLRQERKRSYRGYQSSTAYINDETIRRWISRQAEAAIEVNPDEPLPTVLGGIYSLPPSPDGSFHSLRVISEKPC